MYKDLKKVLLGAVIVGAVSQSVDALAKLDIKSVGTKKFKVSTGSVGKKVSASMVKSYFKKKYGLSVDVSTSSNGSLVISGASQKQIEDAFSNGFIFK